MQNFLKNFLKVVALAIFLFTFAFSVSTVFAGASQNVTGFAWSDNIGWISLNNLSDGSAIDYGVNKNADGTLAGFGWSDNVGWIKFGGLSGFPTGAGTVASNARVATSNTNLEGWARACSGMADPVGCTNTVVLTPGGPNVTDTFDFTTATNGQTSTNGQGYYWDVPAGVTSFTAELWGSGGSGGTGSCCAPQGRSGSGAGGGGGSGAYGKTVVQIPVGVTRYYIIVGETGVAPTGNTNTYLMTNPNPAVVGSRLIAGSGSNGVQGGVGGSNASGATQMLWANGGNGGVGGLLGSDSPSTVWQVQSSGVAGIRGQDGGYTFCGGNGWGYPGAGGNGGSQTYGGTGGLGGKHPKQNFYTAQCPTDQTYPPATINPGGVGGLPGAGGGGGEGYGGVGGLGGRGRVAITYASTVSAPDPRGGWDGWISFKGTTPTYNVLANNTGTFCVSDSCTNLSWAWGSDILGWIDFSGVTFGSNPPGVTATPTAGACTIDLSYAPSAGATSYQLMRSLTSASSGFSPLGSPQSTISGLQNKDTTISAGANAHYKLVATKSGIDTESTVSDVVVPSNCMPAPTNVVAETISCSSASAPTGSVTLKWDAVAAATGYDIYDNNLFVKSTGLLQTTISGLVAGSSHSYKVLARDLAGNTTILNTAPIVLVTIPTCLSVSCSATPTTVDLNSLVPVTWTANVSNGTGPFNYNWTGDAPLAGRSSLSNSSRSNSQEVNYAGTGAGPKYGNVTVTDSSNPQQSTGQISCTVGNGGSAVTVTDNDFALVVSPVAKFSFVGKTAVSKPVTINLAPTAGFIGDVTVSASPASVTLGGISIPLTYKFYNHGTQVQNNLLSVGNNVGLDMVITASKQIPKGNYSQIITVTGTSGVITHTYRISISSTVFTPVFQEF